MMIFYRMKKGFTFVEIMVVVGIIAVLVAIAIPNLLRARLNANEHYAISNIQTISIAAQTYWSALDSGDSAIPLPTALSQLHGEGYIDETLGSQGCIKNGYKYYMGGTGTEASFYVYTIPETPDVTGVRSFCAGSDGVTRVDPSGATPGSRTVCIALDPL